MKSLTSRERYIRMFRGEPIDRIPVCPRVYRNVVFDHSRLHVFGDICLERIAE